MTESDSPQTGRTRLVDATIFEQLQDRHGAILSGTALVRTLGFPSSAAFRQARIRGTVGVPVFTIPHRRSVFALTIDVAEWLERHRTIARVQTKQKEAAMS